MSASAVPSTEKPASVWEDFVDVLYAPSRVFARRANAGAGMPLLILAVLAAVLFLATRSFLAPYYERMFDAQLAAAAAQNPQLAGNADAAAMTRRIADMSVLAGGFVGTPIFVLIVALITWLVGRLMGGALTYGKALLITTYAFVPRVLGSLAAVLVLLVRDVDTLPLGLQSFAGPAPFLAADASPVLVAIAGRFDLFTLWTTVLLGIGIAVIGRVPRAKGWTAAGIIWTIGTVFAVLGALRQAAAMG